MLDLLFSFRGRIGRLQYFLTGLVVGLAVIAGLVAIIAMVIGAFSPPAHPNAGALLMLLGLALLVLLMVPLLIWSGLALQAKRIRDIGLDPLIVIPVVIVIGMFDGATAQAVPNLALFHGVGGTNFGGAGGTIFGLVVHLGYAGCLTFWPGRSYDGGAPSAWTTQPEPDEAPFPAMPVTQPQPQAAAWQSAPVRTGFGRRGLT